MSGKGVGVAVGVALALIFVCAGVVFTLGVVYLDWPIGKKEEVSLKLAPIMGLVWIDKSGATSLLRNEREGLIGAILEADDHAHDDFLHAEELAEGEWLVREKEAPLREVKKLGGCGTKRELARDLVNKS